jgi:hypothetical protein|nr:MAG TPA: Protein of unknown function (DUF1642) [Caudoviricetes sp.]
MNLSNFIARCERVSSFTNEVDIHNLISDLKKINESQKAKVPNFIGDWIYKAQLVDDLSLCVALEYTTIKLYAKNSEEILKWLEIRENQETFARAWIYGYEVEKEKRYSVKIKGKIEENLLVYGLGIDRYFFARTYDSSKRNEHTRKELEEAGFYWVFDCPGIEIEEVE